MTLREEEATLPAGGTVRLVNTVLGVAMTGLCLAWAAGVYRMLGFQFLTEQRLAVVMGLALALVYVTRPFRPGRPRTHLPSHDAILAILALAACL